jgi:hypothetical protein
MSGIVVGVTGVGIRAIRGLEVGVRVTGISDVGFKTIGVSEVGFNTMGSSEVGFSNNGSVAVGCCPKIGELLSAAGGGTFATGAAEQDNVLIIVSGAGVTI